MAKTATYTKIESPTTAIPDRRRSSTRVSIELSQNNFSSNHHNDSIRRRSSGLGLPSNNRFEPADELPPALEYVRIRSTTDDNDMVKHSGVLNVGNVNRRQSFSTKPRPVSFGDYCQVLYKYPNYRSYLLSHVCQHTGDWFVRIASILIVEELTSNGETGEALASMALASKIPMAIFAPVGGVLADRFDRRTLMIIMDVLSGVVVLGYLIGIHFRSLSIIFVVTALRSALGASYYPVTTGIVPSMVPDPRDLQLAVTMNSWAWGTMAIVGGMVAGSLAAAIGLRTCYYVDCATFLVSALVIKCGVKGNFKVKRTSMTSATLMKTSLNKHSANDLKPVDDLIVIGTNNIHHKQPSPQANTESPMQEAYKLVRELMIYLCTCGFGMMVFLKSSASFVWGIEDIVGAEFSTVYNGDGTEDERLSSLHMGMLFSVVGIGCMTGPALVNLITDSQRPHTLQRACLFGVFFLTGGWLMISLTQTFPQFLAGTFVRTMVG
jgi:MFS family permease